MPQQEDDSLLHFPCEVLYELLFDAPSYIFTEPIRSKTHPSDFTPLKCRLEIGQILQAKDPEETYFKVHLYPENRIAEIWAAREWNESLSKRLRGQVSSAESTVAFTKAHEDFAAISRWIEDNMGVPRDAYMNGQLSRTFMKIKVLPEEMKSFTGLEELLKKHGKLI